MGGRVSIPSSFSSLIAPLFHFLLTPKTPIDTSTSSSNPPICSNHPNWHTHCSTIGRWVKSPSFFLFWIPPQVYKYTSPFYMWSHCADVLIYSLRPSLELGIWPTALAMKPKKFKSSVWNSCTLLANQKNLLPKQSLTFLPQLAKLMLYITTMYFTLCEIQHTEGEKNHPVKE